jgi:VCBS repeat-containing protein
LAVQIAENAESLRVAQARGVLELSRPKPGEEDIYNANDYSRIDFRSIVGQWQQLHPEGRSLVIAFGNGAVIQISNFFGEDGSAGSLIAQVDDATYLSPDFFLLKYSTVGSSADSHSDVTHIPSGADFVDPPDASPLLGNDASLRLLADEANSISTLDFLPSPILPLISPLPPPSPPLPSVNQPPMAVDDAATVAEGGTVTTVNVLANDTDPDSPLTAANITFTQAAHGTVVNNGDGTFSYTHDGTETASDSFTYTIDDGAGGSATATVNITVTPVNDPPQATPVLLTPIAQDSGARTITSAELLTGVSDIDGPSLLISSLTIASGSGTLVNNSNGTWSYTPAAGDSSSVTFNYTASDGLATASSTASLDITPVNTAPPGLDLDGNNSNGGGSDYTATFKMGGQKIPITDTDVVIADPDSTTLASARVSLVGNGQVPPKDILSINGTLPAGISASAYDPVTGVLTLTGAASIADYQTALHQIVFSTTDAFYNADRIVSVTVNDGAHTSNTAQAFLHISSFAATGTALVDDPTPYFAFSLDTAAPNAISADLTDLVGGSGGQQLDYDLVPFSPGQASWSWLDQSALPVVSASPAAITDAEAGTYTALVFAGTTGVSAVAFTVLGDAAAEFDITVDAAGSGAGERDSGNRSIGDLIVVDDSIAGTVTAGAGDDIVRMLAGTGNHSLDGGDGNDALYGNAGNDTLDGGTGNNFLSGAGGADVLVAGSGDDILLGGDGADQLSAGDGDNVMMGGAGNDILTGGAGRDVLLGGAGNDTLTGGGGRDVFFFTDDGAANADQILDYNIGDGDIVDLSALLDNHFGPADNPADFARVIQSGSDVIVQVDADGPAGGANFTDVATLSGYGTPGADLVNVLFAGAVHQFTV